MGTRRPPPDFCANCGAPLPRDAVACPECGADERTGWRETSVYDGLDLPGDEAGRGASESRASLGRPPGWRHALPWYWVALALLVAAALALGALGLWR